MRRQFFRPLGTVLFRLVVVGCCAAAVSLQAGPLVSTESPIAFFTNVASRLLKSELDVDLNNIQIYPTNQYTPSVHRLLQVTANLYEAITNQMITDYPFVPFVYRPLFRRATAGEILIAGYREVTNADLVLNPPLMADPVTGELTNAIPALGTPFDPSDSKEPMVYGLPLIIGARKGFPNFNEFLMQTHIKISRKLEFRRPDPASSVNETNVMYTLSISNAFGFEAWNSYQSNYTRTLQVVAVADMMAAMTNENGAAESALLSAALVSPFYAAASLVTDLWSGYTPLLPGRSMLLPLNSNFGFLTNHSYSDMDHQFIPLSSAFERHPNLSYFPVPHWWLNLRTRVRFMLVDTNANRIVDYVNLDTQERPLDLTYAFMQDTPGHPVVGANDSLVPAGLLASYWITNRFPVGADVTQPTQGIMNQWLTSLGQISPTSSAGTWNDITGRPITANNVVAAISSFVYQFQPWNEPLKSNIFYAPFVPVRDVYFLTTWQANDPLVHYRLDDLVCLTNGSQTNRFQFVPGKQFSDSDILTNIGVIVNDRYDPWPTSSGPKGTNYNIALKDPQVRAGPLMFVGSDSWDFPTNQPLGTSWLGRVHRGTPWQTIYLKSPFVDFSTWQHWLGWTNADEAQRAQPTNDWRLVSELAPLFNPVAPQDLISINQDNPSNWAVILDGLTVFTNGTSLAPIIVSSNSLQAVTVANGILAIRSTQPGRVFWTLGDILATPELTWASPWLNTNSLPSPLTTLTDQALEALPSQLLPLLRPDSIASIAPEVRGVQIQFTGLDDYRYRVEVSSDLLTWTAVTTNQPTHGVFTLVDSPGSLPRFYRSVLLP